MNDVKLVNTEFALRQGASEVTLPAKTTAGDSAPNRQADEIASELTDVAEQGAEQVEQAVANLNEYVQSVQRDLQFRLDDTSGKTVITVYDRSTEEVVRQIPDDVAIRLARDLQQDEPISLFKAKV
ncbi:hypothetical protein A3715_14930 [Oleiphilus sp. HI0009]|uniref:flagellar protein FlaG n=2 Tax=Oleiphilus TaxID=141450 RepID=UPI0007C31906|nr:MULTISPECIES: flagellar protein FlaG [unclassified Oleiphilus]KZX74942.1 hypothetical protein A3715_14930 [Oleiphilus sp. HI0009]KZY69476.1 hypothetical protein A3738_04560 [Oleiphilus sp. HI0066]KZY72001.1 hypothetical protein A3739_16240 [Oleiphilus sp. HI0067]MCH2159207.1 flagellar protein FlaG [Oleiphilaceae bacterium]